MVEEIDVVTLDQQCMKCTVSGLCAILESMRDIYKEHHRERNGPVSAVFGALTKTEEHLRQGLETGITEIIRYRPSDAEGSVAMIGAIFDMNPEFFNLKNMDAGQIVQAIERILPKLHKRGQKNALTPLDCGLARRALRDFDVGLIGKTIGSTHDIHAAFIMRGLTSNPSFDPAPFNELPEDKRLQELWLTEVDDAVLQGLGHSEDRKDAVNNLHRNLYDAVTAVRYCGYQSERRVDDRTDHVMAMKKAWDLFGDIYNTIIPPTQGQGHRSGPPRDR
jgi:hypothetical protein